MSRIAIACALASSLGVGAIALHGQETRSASLLTTEHYLDWERVRDAQISPDGTRIVYIHEHVQAAIASPADPHQGTG